MMGFGRASEGRRGGGLRRRAAAWLCFAAAAFPVFLPALRGANASRDLDVAVPPGSPLDWGRAFPALSPGAKSIFPKSGVDDEPEIPADGGRSTSEPASSALDVRISSSFGIVRILTWDLAAHLTWISARPKGPSSGRSSVEPDTPVPGDALYWATLAPLLRLILHPAAVSEAETLAHLVEVGEPVRGVLATASSERALKKTCETIRTMLEPTVDAAAAPLVREDAREAMWSRFVFEELRREFAYDPEGGFGERLFLFGEELEPYVAEYASSGNAFVRRNAVAALGRFRTRSAIDSLLSIASETKDPVTLMRALSALGRFRSRTDWAPLLVRLEGCEDSVERVALIGALGRVGMPEAAPALVKIGDRARRHDSDLLMSTLSALAQIQKPEMREAVEAFAIEVDRQAKNSPRGFQPESRPSGIKPDVPDPPQLRTQIIGQLALIVRARLDPLNEDLGERLLELLSEPPAGNTPRVYFQYPSRQLQRIPAPVRFLYIGTLRRLGDAGRDALLAIAGDPNIEPSLRSHALKELSWSEREELLSQILTTSAESAEIKVHAFELAAFDRHSRLEELGRAILKECAEAKVGAGEPVQRYLYLSAVRALSERKKLTASDLASLLHHLRAARDSHGDLPERIQVRVAALVQLAITERKGRLKDEIDEILDLVISSGVNPRITEDTRRSERDFVLGQVSGVRARKNDVPYHRLVGKNVTEHLLGFPMEAPRRAQGEFIARVLLEEEILLALGRTGEAQAVVELIGFLDNKESRHRAVACLALGLTGRPAAADKLAPYLLDSDAFTRLCAYESLRHLTGEDYFVDWMYGTSSERFAAAEKYWKWIIEKR